MMDDQRGLAHPLNLLRWNGLPVFHWTKPLQRHPQVNSAVSFADIM